MTWTPASGRDHDLRKIVRESAWRMRSQVGTGISAKPKLEQRPDSGWRKMFDIENDDITGRYWTCLDKMISAFSYGEPFFKLLIGEKVGKWLLDKGLVEEVANPQWPSHKPCYRLTQLGHDVIKRGRYAKPRPKRPKLRMLEPRIKPLKNRFEN